jgi:hypothetical protein
MKRLLLLAAVAALVLPASAAGASAHTVDLATGTVDGHRILGRTIAGVTAALGRPDFRQGSRVHYAVGWGMRPDFSFEVLFRSVGGAERAWSIALERGPVRDVKLGDLLSRNSPALQTAILKTYADSFKLVRAYRCSGSICAADLVQRTGQLHLTLGTRPKLGTWLTIYRVPAP